MADDNKPDVLILYEVSRGQPISTDDYEKLNAKGLVGLGRYTDINQINARQIRTTITEKGDQIIRKALAS
ncbi:hypothetical protein F0267_01215 [Vibrio coralliilyticus]|uniref:Uncharacterized protein n=1 Tax=Vibrio coralliilyticus TaxID=190893 RepID=A0AAN0SGU0_9VIBR|nr:hypothetical protein [Vibrio coralliilyticus]AIW22287.1 hypothetical protein IX92_24775 [Vibrio coralliilyticus]NOH36842.1 hypothetical protein [Vibrio coralliilyticus]